MTKGAEILTRYHQIGRLMTEKYRHAIKRADPRVDLLGAFHLAHNWGNAAAKDLLALHVKRQGQILDRQHREYKRWERSK